MNDNLAQMYRESQRQLREALEAVEWTLDLYGALVCPWCGGSHYAGHRPDCQRQAALGEKVESA